MQQFKAIHLFLDNDNAGDRATAFALSLGDKKFIDKRNLYKGYKDLNDGWLHNITDKPAPS